MEQQTLTNIKELIVKCEDRLLTAIKRNDLVTLDKLLHEDLLFILPDGNVITKKMDLDSHKAGTMVVEEIESTIEKINVIEETASVVVVYKTKGQMMDQPIEGNFRYIRFWKRCDDGWKVIGGSCTRVS